AYARGERSRIPGELEMYRKEAAMRISGACHCGAITVEGEADPDRVSICHCTDCQTGTGSAFRVSVPVPGDSFKMTGTPTSYVKTTAEGGKPGVQAFRPPCGLL